ncbi:hypothetical protein C7E19_20390 [Stenotrophomonas maltophilia]|nr:hypothetical protein C7E19_20390 [Stenotrophomonas maltophilia]
MTGCGGRRASSLASLGRRGGRLGFRPVGLGGRLSDRGRCGGRAVGGCGSRCCGSGGVSFRAVGRVGRIAQDGLRLIP